MKTLILGGTDLTMAILKSLVESGRPPIGVVSIAKEFSISYNPGSVNSRFADIEAYCAEHNIRHMVYNKDVDALVEFATNIQADFCLVAGWYFMLPERFRKMFSFGCLGLHASLLPQLRGAAPLNWAILNDMKETGISLFEIVKGVDEGQIYAQQTIALNKRETITTLVKKVELASIEIILSSYDKIESGEIQPQPQSGEATYSCPRRPEDSQINWEHDVASIDRLVRASCRPYQGAYTHLEGQKITIWAVDTETSKEIYGRSGQICKISGEDYPYIVCGNGIMKVTEATHENGESAISYLLSKNYSTFDKQGG